MLATEANHVIRVLSISDICQWVRLRRFYDLSFLKHTWIEALNGCHRDAGHQGQQQMHFLLQDCFYRLGIGQSDAEDTEELVKGASEHEGPQSKAATTSNYCH